MPWELILHAYEPYKSKCRQGVITVNSRLRLSARPALVLVLILLIVGTATADSEPLAYPAVGFWNGFLRQTNVVECSQFGPDAAQFRLSLYDQQRNLLAARDVDLVGGGTSHIVLSELAVLEDRYGLYEITSRNSSRLSHLRCATAVYRFSQQAGRNIDYGYMLPLKNFVRGVRQGLFNSMNPEASGGPVYNWLTLYNPGSSELQLNVRSYNLAGSETGSQRIRLARGERRDVPLGHDNPQNNFQNVGAYAIEPEDLERDYAAYLVRYGSNRGEFRFAFPLYPQAGSEQQLAFAATVNNALNWAEVANLASTSCDVRLKIRDRSGAILSQSIHRVEGHAQLHYFVNGVLGSSGLGTIEAETLCSSGKIVLQNLYYGFTSNQLEWAYATQDELSQADEEHRLGFFANTFLGMANWLKVRNGDGVARASRVEMYDGAGNRKQDLLLSLAQNEATDIPVHEALPANSVGLALFSAPDQTLGAKAELLRVILSRGQVQTVIYIPPVIIPEAESAISLELVSAGLDSPVAMTSAHDGSNRMYVCERAGKVRLIESGTLMNTAFLDLSHKVSTEGEMGLLSVAFHPLYSSNGKFYAIYNEANYDTVLSEFQRSGDIRIADLNSEREILRIPQPHYFHKGGQLSFGPDGFLYISLGDGGFSGDPSGNGQNKNTLLGKILRLDVNAVPYAIPSDNPFVGEANARPEVWAYGFRNPWRFSFDRLSGELFAADVGEASIEEIDIVVRGANYGWNEMEGSRCFEPAENCDRSGKVLPIAEYTHSEGLAVVGGYRYRGNDIPQLEGKYVFGDYVSGRIWSLAKNQAGVWMRSQLARPNFYISAFGESDTGELYVVSIFGAVYRVAP